MEVKIEHFLTKETRLFEKNGGVAQTIVIEADFSPVIKCLEPEGRLMLKLIENYVDADLCCSDIPYFELENLFGLTGNALKLETYEGCRQLKDVEPFCIVPLNNGQDKILRIGYVYDFHFMKGVLRFDLNFIFAKYLEGIKKI